MPIIISEDPQGLDGGTERNSSLGSNSADDQSVRSARAMKVFGDLVNDESSLCYSPSPSKKNKNKSLRNITNVCNSSPSHVLPFREIEFTGKKNPKKSSGQVAKNEKKSEIELKEPKNSEYNKISASIDESAPDPRFVVKKSNQSALSKEVPSKKRAIQKTTKMSPAKKHVPNSKFRGNTSSIKRQAQANKARRAIRQATESVNQTLNASRIAKIDHHRNVAEQVAILREEWIAEKEEAAQFYAEVANTKKEMLQLRNQLSSQYAQNKADSDRQKYQQRLNELDREIKFKSDVFVEHKRKLKENEDRRRRLSTMKKDDMFRERKQATERMDMERIEEEHERFEHKWKGEDDVKDHKRQCELNRRDSYAFRNAEASKFLQKRAEQESQEKLEVHEKIELKWAGEDDAKEYLRQCDIARRESFAFRNAEGRRQRNEEEERQVLAKAAEHKSYEQKWAGEKDAEEYLRKCELDRRDSFAFRNAEGRAQRAAEAERNEDMKIAEHERYELKWAGEEDAKKYLRQCEERRRDSFAFRNAEGSRQRLEQEERDFDKKAAEHESYELKWRGEDDVKEYRKRCEKARRESLAFRGRECIHHKEVMNELQNLAKEKEHEYYVLKWAAQDDVKEYLGQVAEHRRQSLAFRNREGKRHRDLEEEWKCEELERRHELELARSACQKDVENYKKECSERDRASLIYRGKEIQIQRMITEHQRAIEDEEDEKRRDLETLARGDVEEYVKDCKRRRRLSLAQRATESRRHMSWKKQQEQLKRAEKSRHTRNMGLDRRYVELAKEKERAKKALNDLRRAQSNFSTSNPFGSILE